MELDLSLAGDVTWSVTLRVDGQRMPLSSPRAHLPLRTAAVGKILLLLALARRVADGEIELDEPLKRTREDWVQDSGLWHTLSSETLPLSDVAGLVGAVSDSLATNVLLRRIGLDAVASATTSLGLMRTALHDRVRGERGPTDPPLSVGTTLELSWLASRIMRGAAMGADADRLVRQWLSASVDQSLVGAAFVERLGMDPLAHHESLGGGLRYWNKTGTDAGVRADVGAATVDGRTVAWAAVANWDAGRAHDPGAVRQVLQGMRRIGATVLDALTSH